MFCGECGTKNEKSDAFCKECGRPLIHEENNITGAMKQPRKPMSKKNKIIIGVLAVIILVLGIGYKVGSDMTSPEAIAEDYIKAVINKDSDRLYKYLELEGDKTFVSKKIFKELMGNTSDDDSSSIENYKITEVTYGDGKLTAKVKFTYTEKGSTDEETEYVNLTKQKDNKYFIFDNWKIADLSTDSMAMKDYKIKVTKGSTVTFSGVKLTDKYLSKEDSTSTVDVYVLPLVFTTTNTLKTVLPSGIEIEEKVTPSKYYSTHTVSFDEDSLTDAAKDKLITKSKEVLTSIYTNAIAKKQFNEIKSSFEHSGLDLTDLETNYNSFVSDLSSASSTLTSIEFTDASLYDVELNDDGYLEVEVRVNYNYSVSYTDWNDEVQTHSDTSYDYMTIVLAFDKDDYYLVDIDELEDYFSRY